MNKNKIDKIKTILTEWNPIGDKSVPDLNGYETEIYDIICNLTVDYDFPKKEINVKQLKKILREVLNEAFDLYLTDQECNDPAIRIMAKIKEN